MKMMSGSRRTITPTTPMEKSTADNPRYQDSGTKLPSALSPPRQQQDTNHRGQEQHRRYLERKEIVGEQQAGDGLHTVGRRPRRRPPARAHRDHDHEQYEQD